MQLYFFEKLDLVLHISFQVIEFHLVCRLHAHGQEFIDLRLTLTISGSNGWQAQSLCHKRKIKLEISPSVPERLDCQRGLALLGLEGNIFFTSTRIGLQMLQESITEQGAELVLI